MTVSETKNGRVAGFASGPPRTAVELPPKTLILRSVLSFGIYAYVWLWQISRFTDKISASPRKAHRASRIAALASLFYVNFLILAGILLLLGNPDESGALPVMMLFTTIGMAFAVVGVYHGILAFYRVTKVVQTEQRKRLQPAIDLWGFLLLLVLPLVNGIAPFVMIYKVQRAFIEVGFPTNVSSPGSV